MPDHRWIGGRFNLIAGRCIQLVNFLLVMAIADGPEVAGKIFCQRQTHIAEAKNADRFIEKFFETIKIPPYLKIPEYILGSYRKNISEKLRQ